MLDLSTSEVRLLEHLVNSYLLDQQARRHKAIAYAAKRDPSNARVVRESDGEFAMRMEPLTALRRKIAEYLDANR